MAISSGGLVAAYVAFPLLAYWNTGTVAGYQSFVRPVFFAVLAWGALSGRSWARWTTALVCAIGSVLWFRYMFFTMDMDVATAAVFAAGGLALIGMTLLFTLSDDVAAHFQLRRARD